LGIHCIFSRSFEPLFAIVPANIERQLSNANRERKREGGRERKKELEREKKAREQERERKREKIPFADKALSVDLFFSAATAYEGCQSCSSRNTTV